jgi:4-carboxymuconolactone decarboxylase
MEECNEVKADPDGMQFYKKVLAKCNTKPLDGVREFTLNHLFAKIWSREPSLLSLRDRRLITLSLLTFQGHTDQLADHIKGAIKNTKQEGGLSKEELTQIMIHIAHYGGWAAGTSGQNVLQDVLKKINCERDSEDDLC